mmetsp:Transcript_50690/g.121049  ORF Transcript_50690/g.121049 Transcript_50690/m.121049 type:complete len:268 (+) Transcript_50690:2521-3324(+)
MPARQQQDPHVHGLPALFRSFVGQRLGPDLLCGPGPGLDDHFAHLGQRSQHTGSAVHGGPCSAGFAANAADPFRPCLSDSLDPRTSGHSTHGLLQCCILVGLQRIHHGSLPAPVVCVQQPPRHGSGPWGPRGGDHLLRAGALCASGAGGLWLATEFPSTRRPGFRQSAASLAHGALPPVGTEPVQELYARHRAVRKACLGCQHRHRVPSGTPEGSGHYGFLPAAHPWRVHPSSKVCVSFRALRPRVPEVRADVPEASQREVALEVRR